MESPRPFPPVRNRSVTERSGACPRGVAPYVRGRSFEDLRMLFGLVTFTLMHVLLSLAGIFAGLVVAGALVSGRRLDSWTGVFLTTTVLTNVTGSFFPFVALLPSHIVG